MGSCISKKNNYPYLSELKDNSELIDNSKTSNDKIYFIINGRLHINNEKYYYTKIYFYEDYLYIKNDNFQEEISYYKNKNHGCIMKQKKYGYFIKL